MKKLCRKPCGRCEKLTRMKSNVEIDGVRKERWLCKKCREEILNFLLPHGFSRNEN